MSEYKDLARQFCEESEFKKVDSIEDLKNMDMIGFPNYKWLDMRQIKNMAIFDKNNSELIRQGIKPSSLFYEYNVRAAYAFEIKKGIITPRKKTFWNDETKNQDTRDHYETGVRPSPYSASGMDKILIPEIGTRGYRLNPEGIYVITGDLKKEIIKQCGKMKDGERIDRTIRTGLAKIIADFLEKHETPLNN